MHDESYLNWTIEREFDLFNDIDFSFRLKHGKN